MVAGHHTYSPSEVIHRSCSNAAYSYSDRFCPREAGNQAQPFLDETLSSLVVYITHPNKTVMTLAPCPLGLLYRHSNASTNATKLTIDNIINSYGRGVQPAIQRTRVLSAEKGGRSDDQVDYFNNEEKRRLPLSPASLPADFSYVKGANAMITSRYFTLATVELLYMPTHLDAVHH